MKKNKKDTQQNIQPEENQSTQKEKFQEKNKDTKKSMKEDDIKVSQKQLDELEKQLSDEKDKYIRLYAEFDNFRKRTRKEKEELIETASENVIKSLLPVLDDFERALNEISKENQDEHYKGFILIYEKMKKILSEHGLSTLEVKKGDTFDPDKHEAIAQIPGDKKMTGKIHDVIEKGYKLGNKIIRYPKVVTNQ